MFSELNGTMNPSSFVFIQQPTAWWPPDFSVKTRDTASPFSTSPGASCWSLRTPWSGSRCPRGRFSTRAAASCGGALSCSQTWWRPAGSSWPTQPSARRPAWRWSTESTDRNRRSPWALWSRWRCCWSSEILIHLFISTSLYRASVLWEGSHTSAVRDTFQLINRKHVKFTERL